MSTLALLNTAEYGEYAHPQIHTPRTTVWRAAVCSACTLVLKTEKNRSNPVRQKINRLLLTQARKYSIITTKRSNGFTNLPNTLKYRGFFGVDLPGLLTSKPDTCKTLAVPCLKSSQKPGRFTPIFSYFWVV